MDSVTFILKKGAWRRHQYHLFRYLDVRQIFYVFLFVYDVLKNFTIIYEQNLINPSKCKIRSRVVEQNNFNQTIYITMFHRYPAFDQNSRKLAQ